jgi:hypothetical protein
VRRALLAVCLLLLAACPAARAVGLPPVRHVFVIVLENEAASTTFASPSPAPYLAHTLRSQGAFLQNYYGIGHESLDNYVAMISGQAPNLETQADCPVYTDVVPGSVGSGGQAFGLGCVYPSGVPTIASQLTAAGLRWRSYNESMGADPSREASQCGHPRLNSTDGTQTASSADQYATRHNPFVYFHAIVDSASLCGSHVVNLKALPADLASTASTPNYVFITPDLCSDGHDASCADRSRPGGFAAIDQFLERWVPLITGSSAYQHDGLLMIVFDESGTTDTSACCGEVAGPGSPLPGLLGPGGGNTGAVLLSPFIAPGTTSGLAYNHYTMLRSVEDIFGLGHIGYAASGQSFAADVFTQPGGPPPSTTQQTASAACVARALPRGAHGRLPAGSLLQSIRVVRTAGRAALIFQAIHNARLRLTLEPGRRLLLSRSIRACHFYRTELPGRHGKLRIVASVAQGSQRAARGY